MLIVHFNSWAYFGSHSRCVEIIDIKWVESKMRECSRHTAAYAIRGGNEQAS